MTASFDHVALSVADLEVQRRFYAEAFALIEVGERGAPGDQLRTVLLAGDSGLTIELVARTGSSRAAPHGHGNSPLPHTDPQAPVYEAAATQGCFQWAVTVADLANACLRLGQAGATVALAPTAAERPGLRYAYVLDPEGNQIELVEHAKAEGQRVL